MEVLATVADALKLTDGSVPRIGLPSSAGIPALAAAAHASTAEPEAPRAAKDAAKEPERVLKRFASEEKASRIVDVFESIALETKAAAKAGRFANSDPAAAGTVEFEVRKFVDHISTMMVSLQDLLFVDLGLG